MLSRVRRHLRWRLDTELRRRSLELRPTVPDKRLHALAPDDFELRGVRLDLGEDWVTPTLRAAIYDGVYERPEAEIIEATMDRADRVLEIGCGIGFLGTLASRIVEDPVRCYDADPAIIGTARRTIDRNHASATAAAAVLQRDPTVHTTVFYLHNDFWLSSLTPNPEAVAITVAVLDFEREIGQYEASYLIVDIEGSETGLLLGAIPTCVRKLCVECHPTVSAPDDISAMLVSLISQGFALNLQHSRPPVLYFERDV